MGLKLLLLRQSVGLIFTSLLSYFCFHPPFSFTPAFRPAHNCFCFFCSHTVRSLTVYINRIPEEQRRMEKAHMEAVCLDLCKEPVRTIYNRSVLHSRCSHYRSLTDREKDCTNTDLSRRSACVPLTISLGRVSHKVKI